MVPKCHPKIVAVNTETNGSPMFRNTHMDALLNNCIEKKIKTGWTFPDCIPVQSTADLLVVAVPFLPISNVKYPTDQLNLIPFSSQEVFLLL